jgi:hypothetical protein
MSASAPPENFDLRKQLVRIDKLREEALKYTQEQHTLIAEASKLSAENSKFSAESAKYVAEAAKLNRDRALSPWIAFVVITGGIGGILAGVVTVLHALGVTRQQPTTKRAPPAPARFPRRAPAS